jgi:hypothetical protein
VTHEGVRVEMITEKDIQDEWKRKAMELPREKRQEFMDYIWQGMTIGEARSKAGIGLYEALAIVNMNIEKKESYALKRETL